MEKFVETGCAFLNDRVIVDTENDNCGLQNLNTATFVSGAMTLPQVVASSAFTPISPVRKQIMLIHLIGAVRDTQEAADAVTTPIPIGPRRKSHQWQKTKRKKRYHQGRKDDRRQRLQWRNHDKEQRILQQRWMKPSKQPGKKPLPIFTQRSHKLSAPSLNPDLPLNQIFNFTER